jgi:preprotein translocase subunit SecF
VAQTAGITPDVVRQKAKDLLNAQPTNVDPKAMSAEQAQQEIAANLPKLATGDDQAKQAARQRITAILAAQANITPEEASQRLDKLQAEATQTKDQAVDKAKQVGDKAATGLSRASLMAFVALLLGAGAAAFGGHLGGRRDGLRRA